jgi:GTP-binding protein Era
MDDTKAADFICGYVAVAGKPNVGKSTLINRLLNFPLSIITPKPQTTRHRILGILSEENWQVIFLDSPGIMTPRYALQDLMVRSAWAAVEEADVVLFMVEAGKDDGPDEDEAVFERLAKLDKCAILAVNKIDLVDKADLLPVIEAYAGLSLFEEIVPISALKADGLDRLKHVVVSHLPRQAPFYPPEELTDRPQRFFVGEMIRQKVFEQYGQEIPYSTAVVIDEYSERPEAKDFIRAVIVCERESQKGILIGKRGQALKRLGAAARADIETFIGKGAFLELKVEVRKDWRKDERAVKRLGQT